MPSSRRRRLALLGLCYAAFVGLGLPDGLLGVAWPSIRASFGLRLDALGALLALSTTGYVAASFASGRALARMGLGSLLALSCFATGGSLLGYAVAPQWSVMLGCAVVAGLGAGAIDAGLNTYVATHHGARTLNWLHACWGVGAASGPALMTRVLMQGRPWPVGYGLVAAGQLALALCFAATRARWPASDVSSGGVASAGRAVPFAETLRLRAARLGIALFLVYTGLEAAVGAWAFSLLTEARGLSMESAGAAVSAYFAALTLGRLVFGALVGAASPGALLRAALAAVVVCAGLLTLELGPRASLAALAGLGLACGPVFPSLIAATPGRVGPDHAANAVGFQVAAAAMGQSLLPAAVGFGAARVGLAIVPPALVSAALLLFALHELLAATPVRVEAPVVS
jgi:fucose permease